jgi:hypothetical protein
VLGCRPPARRPLRSCWRALEVIERQSGEIRDLREQNAQLRELVARQGDQLAEANASLAVLQRMLFGRSSEKSGPPRAAVAVTMPAPVTAGNR